MKTIFNLIFSFTLTFTSFGQIVNRFKIETAEQFAERLKPINTKTGHKVIETNWN